MKKKMRFLALAMAGMMLAGMLAACGGTASSTAPAADAGNETAEPAETGNDDDAVEEAADGEEKTVVFWTHYTDDIGFTTQKVADYNELMAGKVNIEFKHVSDDYNNVLTIALQNGDGPDLFADGIELGQMVQANYVAPLDDLMSDQMKERAASFAMEANNQIAGKWYSLPFRGYNFRLVWNKDMFEAAGLDPEAPPTSYDELLEYAAVLTEYGADKNQYAFMLPTGEEWIWWIYGIQMARANGENNFDYNSVQYTWESFEPVMNLYLDLKDMNALFPGGTTMQNDPARAQFSAGTVGMMLAASWDIGVFNDQFPAEIEWGVAELPNQTGDFEGYVQLDCGSYLLINAASDVQQEAMDFYEYLLSEEVLVEYYEQGYGIPVYDGISGMATIVPEKPGFAGFADVSNDHVYPNEPSVQVEGQVYGAVWNDVMNGNMTVEQAIDDLNSRYNAAVEQGAADGLFDLDDFTIEGFSCKNPLGT